MDANTPIAGNSELKGLVHGIEQLVAQRDLLGRKMSRIYKDAKAKGYDKNALRQVIRLRAQDPTERQQQEKIVGDYMRAVELAEQQGEAALAERIPWPGKARLMAGR